MNRSSVEVSPRQIGYYATIFFSVKINKPENLTAYLLERHHLYTPSSGCGRFVLMNG
jgi:hypothetical protein